MLTHNSVKRQLSISVYSWSTIVEQFVTEFRSSQKILKDIFVLYNWWFLTSSRAGGIGPHRAKSFTNMWRWLFPYSQIDLLLSSVWMRLSTTRGRAVAETDFQWSYWVNLVLWTGMSCRRGTVGLSKNLCSQEQECFSESLSFRSISRFKIGVDSFHKTLICPHVH